jgi:spermidine/putrescine-binding protein
MAVRPYIRTFDSNDYWHQLASKEVCLSDRLVERLFGGSGARARRRHRSASGVHLPKEGSNITYNAFLIPASAPHRRRRTSF